MDTKQWEMATGKEKRRQQQAAKVYLKERKEAGMLGNRVTGKN